MTPQQPPKKLTLKELQARRARAEGAFQEAKTLVKEWEDGGFEAVVNAGMEVERLVEVHGRVMDRVAVIRAGNLKERIKVREGSRDQRNIFEVRPR